MSLPTVFKSAPFWTGMGTVGVGGAGVTVWQFYGTENVGQLNSLDPSGLGVFSGDDGNVVEPNIGSPTIKISSCFENFFPGVGKVQFASGGSASDVTPPTPSSKEITDSKPTLGCALAQLAYLELENKHNSANGLSKLVFRSELAFRNDKTGWVIWVLWDGKLNSASVTDWYQYLRYYVLFMESSGGFDWSIKGGYWWKDIKASDPSANESHIQVGDDVWMGKDMPSISNSPIPASWKKQEYMGFWKEGGGNVGLLNGMELRSRKDDNTKCEVFCKNKKDQVFEGIKADNDENRYFGQLVRGSDNRWIWTQEEKKKANDLISNLNSWYSPFKDGQGKWNTMQPNFCSTHPIPDNGISDFEFKSLCYKK